MWIRSSGLAAFAISVVGVLGCSPNPELVYIDLAAAADAEREQIQFVRLGGEDLTRAELSIDDLDSSRLFIGSAEDRAALAMKAYVDNQERAYLQALERLEGTYLREVESYDAEHRRSILEEHDKRVDTTFLAIREEFEVHANHVGKMWQELAWLARFPDPDPDSRRVPPASNEVATSRFERAKQLREQLALANSKHRDSVSATLAALDAALSEDMDQLKLELDVRRRAAIDRAEQAARIAAQAELEDVQRSALDPEAVLVAVDGVIATVDGVPGSLEPWNASPNRQQTEQEIARHAETYARLRGYVLSDDPGEEDVTEDFVSWRKQFALGR
ncbi:MAG: hypothetical protein IH944_06325 [Armatimonadetes bacterium]|nr:hypothetical protein [Armatimonadota bacterium]